MPRYIYTETALEFLADGQWHPEIEVAIGLLKAVPPERAVRVALKSRKDTEEMPLTKRVQIGMKAITLNTLRQLESKGRARCEEVGGKRRWQIVVPQEEAAEADAWSRAFQERGISDNGAVQ